MGTIISKGKVWNATTAIVANKKVIVGRVAPLQIKFALKKGFLSVVDSAVLYPQLLDSTFINLFIYLFLAVLGLRFCARAFSNCGEWGPLFIAVRGPLTTVTSLVAEHRLQTRRLSNCGSRAQLLRGMWDLPRPGLEPMSAALAGRFLTTAPPGKP